MDALNKVYVSGLTTGDDFPTTDGAFQTSNAGFSDAFAVKLDMTKSGSSHCSIPPTWAADSAKARTLYQWWLWTATATCM